jgi:hypothetical protein
MDEMAEPRGLRGYLAGQNDGPGGGAMSRDDGSRTAPHGDPLRDCIGCGAPAGYPPAGPCRDHGTARAVADNGAGR